MRFRSAITGRWVTRLFARRNPRTTVNEGRRKTKLRPVKTAACPYCGALLAITAVFCPYCATDLLED